MVGYKVSKKILFFDVDGTLTNRNGAIPDNTRNAIFELKDAGHTVFVNSGRTMFDLEGNKDISSLGFDGYIGGCGSHIRYHGTDIRHQTVPDNVSDKVLFFAEKLHIKLFLEGPDCVYIDMKYKDKLNQDALIARLGDKVKDIYSEKLCFQKFLCWGMKENLSQFALELKEYFNPIWKGDGAGEFVLHGFDKGESIQEVLSYLNFDSKDCFVIGDSENDMPMFSRYTHSILIGYDADLADKVEFVSKTADEDGVYYGLKHYGLI